MWSHPSYLHGSFNISVLSSHFPSRTLLRFRIRCPSFIYDARLGHHPDACETEALDGMIYYCRISHSPHKKGIWCAHCIRLWCSLWFNDFCCPLLFGEVIPSNIYTNLAEHTLAHLHMRAEQVWAHFYRCSYFVTSLFGFDFFFVLNFPYHVGRPSMHSVYILISWVHIEHVIARRRTNLVQTTNISSAPST